MVYKDYEADFSWSQEDGVFHGRVKNISRDIISFEAKRASDIEEEFKKAVDFYIEMKIENGGKPEKPGLIQVKGNIGVGLSHLNDDYDLTEANPQVSKKGCSLHDSDKDS